MQAVLVAGSILALASTLGPIWVVRAGVVVAIAGAALAIMFAIREMTRMRKSHSTEVRTITDRARQTAKAHHDESMQIIDTFTVLHKALNVELDSVRGDLSSARDELSTLRGTLSSVSTESATRAERITELESVVAEREGTYAALLAEHDRLREKLAEFDEPSAEIVTWPRYGAASKRRNDLLPSAEELWTGGAEPVLVDFAEVSMPLEHRKQA